MEKKRTIHVKGIGMASVPPDYITLTLELEAKNKDYSNVMRIGANRLKC